MTNPGGSAGSGCRPLTGTRGDAPDIAHDRLAIECKHRRSVPAWLTGAMAQATASARNGQMPVAIIHRHGGQHANDLAIVRLADLVALMAAGTPREKHRHGWTKAVPKRYQSGTEKGRADCGIPHKVHT